MRNSYSYTIILATVVFIRACSCSDTDADSFNTLVITRFDGLEKLYADFFTKSATPSISSRDSSLSPRSRVSTRSRNSCRHSYKLTANRMISLQFCRRLLNTSYFKMKRESYVDSDAQKTIEEIRAYYPEIFKVLYEAYVGLGRRAAYAMKDTLFMLPVHVNGVEIISKVFPCLARDERTHEIRQYFISDEYNIKRGTMSEAFNIRFLFRYDRARAASLAVDGLVENPAWNTIEDHDIERTYLNEITLKKPFRKLLCKMNKNDKLRLCASVMNSIRYRSQISFRPSPGNVRAGCVKRVISFEKHNFADGTHKEWTISCRGKSRRSDLLKTYYLCLSGYTADTVYVLRREANDGLYLDHYAQFIPVLMEKMISDSSFLIPE